MRNTETRLAPVGSRAIVKRIEAELKSAGGIALSPSHVVKSCRGKVLAVGAGMYCSEVEAGDVVIFNENHNVKSVAMPDGEQLIVPESEILAVVRGSKF